MIADWLSEESYPLLAGSYGLTYVRDLTPEQVTARLGGRPEDLVPMTLKELEDEARRRFGDRGHFFGLTAIGGWTLVVETLGDLAWSEEILAPLSAGTRVVAHAYLDVKGLDNFLWIEDGRLRFAFYPQEGYVEEVPGELAATMRLIETGHWHLDPHEGPAFMLAEHLTGIAVTPQLLQDASYRCGFVPRPIPSLAT
ncbi:hypothetical protein Nocox_06180 [Nonomuraea coxensis DSM 45129]|uniref:Uncharacterized protein n=1 Tax=Nonomuraea coxensis DSM 45129 TaxID=1122611 RepID=A0ABX8TWZ4_9ACTN|nr:DUF6461 domain-containing protein [Nonomuraea coxensis]QYC38863.1 hypothetical protein Nocox_06180 [Nonomuraea coxensis DSM 45129]